MELILSTYGLKGFGGSETYLLTTAEHLERLGHRVTLTAVELGPMADKARARGVRVAEYPEALPDGPDAVLVQDGVTSLELANRFPDTPQLFISHADAIDFQAPPQLAGAVSGVVVFNDRVAERVRGSALDVDVWRLRQPIDVDWFSPDGVARSRPQRLLAFSNYLRGPRRAFLHAACADLDIELVQVGHPAGVHHDPRRAILEADIVVGYGRSILEAMACGRAAYVFDHKGGDGWVTPAAYPVLEADGFGGRATSTTVTSGRLRDDLGCYDVAMGVSNRDLAVGRHAAHQHAAELVQVIERFASRPRVADDLLPELARVVRVQSQFEQRAIALAQENQTLREELDALRWVTDTRRHRFGIAVGNFLDGARRLKRRAGRR